MRREPYEFLKSWASSQREHAPSGASLAGATGTRLHAITNGRGMIGGGNSSVPEKYGRDGKHDAALRLMIIDGNEIVRVGLRRLLAEQPNFELVAEADNAASGIADALRIAPDILLVDVTLPDDSGIAVCKAVRAAHPHTKVVFFTANGEPASVLEALACGADGFLLKQGGGERLVSALEELTKGRAVLDPEITGIVLEQLRAAPTYKPQIDLTPIEHALLALVAQGKTNKEIAAGLNLSHKSVKTQLSAVFQKIGVARRSEAAAYFAANVRLGPNGPTR